MSSSSGSKASIQPWHQRLRPIRESREWLRKRFYDVLGAAARTNDGRKILRSTLGDLLDWRPTAQLPVTAVPDPPYVDLGRARPPSARRGRPPIFITARFRSGSTLLWNLFRHVDGCTAFYEPLNERRWWDPAHRGTQLDQHHRHVEDYWREYEGLIELGTYYDEDWIRRRLYMDEQSWDPALSAYIRLLVERAPGRPVLQFNRVDFRLAWLRHTFPEARLVHLYRHPRDQWCSSLLDLAAFPRTATLAEFPAHDHFYLRHWAADLRNQFPFLDVPLSVHPYRMFYFIWKLSYLFGVLQSDYSLAFEALVAEPQPVLGRLFAALQVEVDDLEPLTRLVEPVRGRWSTYASDAWFKDHEAVCEDVLRDFFQQTPNRLVDDRGAEILAVQDAGGLATTWHELVN